MELFPPAGKDAIILPFGNTFSTDPETGIGIDTMKKITIGIVAHVDSGKTTLSEALLYLSGSIRSFGRVDKGASFLDNDEIERRRGITIFSKQARFEYGDTSFVMIDTPGHADFSAETERTLGILDYAILLISAADGVKGQTKILWKLLSEYQVPTILFFNKMDREDADKESLLSAVKELAGDQAVDFYDAYIREFRTDRHVFRDGNGRISGNKHGF